MSSSLTWIESPAPRICLPDLAGKNALVTGTSQGIGRAVAELLLENGTRVYGLARKTGGWAHPLFTPLICDVSDLSSLEKTLDQIKASVSTLDYVVNVAGADPKYKIDEIQAKDWDDLVNLNLRAYYFIIKHSLPLLRRGEGKSIVNVSSINYRLGVPGRAVYSATKAGILGLTTGLSRELGKEMIRVNTVTPGWIFTERQMEEYFQSKDADNYLTYLAEQQALPIKISSIDIANHILFYLSQASRASVGHNCVVDGGWLLE
jgi:NAD(P)-dependent dehydrogenase (short-subunit alcohol dehydrogenase family)